MLDFIPGVTVLRRAGAVAVVLCTALMLVAPLASSQESAPDAAITEAENHFRLGVSLYKDGNYREALDEFRRALALEPSMEKAADYAQKSEAQLNLSAVGIDPTEAPEFETFDPESLGPLTESAQLSPEEHKIQRVRELVELAERYLEFQMYKRAQELFEQVLLIAPDNKRAREGFHLATIGALREDVKDVQQLNDEQHERIRAFIEEKKLLPNGADASGIKNYRISVPTIDERVEVEAQKSHIEQVLENTVGVVFEEIHLRDILEFITDTYDINLVVDSRAVLPPEPEEEDDDPRANRNRQQDRGRGQEANDGMIDYINLKSVPLGDALSAILRPLGLDYSVERNFVWISTPESIRKETFESLEVRYYKLNYFGNETLYKVTLDLSSAVEGSGGGGGGGGGGGDSTAGGGTISQGDVSTDPLFDSLEDLFDGFTNDTEVGEIDSRFSSATSGVRRVYEKGEGGLGPAGSLQGEPQNIDLLRSLIFDVYEPGTEEILSYMFFQPLHNTLVVYNTPRHLEDFESKLRELDKMPKQVSIESKFLTIDINDNEKVGFSYNGTVGNRPEKFGIDPNDLGIGDSPFSQDQPTLNDPATLIPFLPDGTRIFDDVVQEYDITSIVSPGPPGNFTLGGIIQSGDDADFLNFSFDFLDQLGESEIMSAPRITTINQKPAFIADVRSEFFVTAISSEASSSTGTGGDTTVTSFTETIEPTEFIFGLTLSVTPHINELNQIRLWLNPSVVSRVGTSTFSQRFVIGDEVTENQLILPQRATQSVWTNVIVEDGDTIVLGGTVSDQTIREEQRMPYISEIPVLGFFFRGKSSEISQTSLLIFVTPEIIDTTGARYFDSGF